MLQFYVKLKGKTNMCCGFVVMTCVWGCLGVYNNVYVCDTAGTCLLTFML